MLTRNYIQESILKKGFSKNNSKNYQKIFFSIKDNLENSNQTLNILSKNFKLNFKITDLRKFQKFNNIVIIGMGGSILGTEAIYGFLKKKIKKNIYFLDDIDWEKILDLKKIKFSKTLFIIISKSGNTIETLSNALFLKVLKKNSKNIIIITERNNNYLHFLSKKLNLFLIEHKTNIGGRYSVLSEVGLVPAYLMGINVIKLRSQCLSFLKRKNNQFLKESALKLSNLINTKKINNLVFLNYSPRLEKFLYWCQQLIGESLGKKNKGFFPVVSNMPKDHHSLLQLYLDGPKDKIFHIFSAEEKIEKKFNTGKMFQKKTFLNNQNLQKIKKAQKNALIKSLKKNKIPFREFIIKNLNEETLGRLFSYFILETIMVGKLINVNPFDQPAVEQVKTFTKKLLS